MDWRQNKCAFVVECVSVCMRLRARRLQPHDDSIPNIYHHPFLMMMKYCTDSFGMEYFFAFVFLFGRL